MMNQGNAALDYNLIREIKHVFKKNGRQSKV